MNKKDLKKNVIPYVLLIALMELLYIFSIFQTVKYMNLLIMNLWVK